MSIIKKIKLKNKEGETVNHEIGADASNVTQDAEHRFVTDVEKEIWNKKQGITVTFEAAADRENIETGESFPTLMGKIKKFFTDLKNVAFSGNYDDLSNKPTLGNVASYGVANNDTTTQAGFVADARIVKTHGDEIDQLSSEFGSFQQSFQDGCSTIAAAITQMGVATASNASPTTMASNIKQIQPYTKNFSYTLTGTTFSVDVSLAGYIPIYAGVTSYHYSATANDNAQNVRFSIGVSGNTVSGTYNSDHTVGGDSLSINFIVIYRPA